MVVDTERKKKGLYCSGYNDQFLSRYSLGPGILAFKATNLPIWP